jgi:hypothetical protein
MRKLTTRVSSNENFSHWWMRFHWFCGDKDLVNADHQVLSIDKLTYAGDLRTVAALANSPN